MGAGASQAKTESQAKIQTAAVKTTSKFKAAAAFKMAKTRTLEDSYSEDKQLGQGGFGLVKLATKKNGPPAIPNVVVIKHMDKQNLIDGGMELADVIREMNIQKKASSHKHCLAMFEHFETDAEFQIVLEAAPGGDLSDRMCDDDFSEKNAATVMYQLCDALAFLHDKLSIAHRDLKPENILFTSKEKDAPIKLADFGLSMEMNPPELNKDKGHSPHYVCPELLRKKNAPGGYNTGAVDMWPAGVLLYFMLAGQPPFDGTEKEGDDTFWTRSLYSRVLKGLRDNCFDGERWEGVSEEAKELIRLLIVKVPADRLSAAEVMKHSWFKDPSIAKLVGAGKLKEEMKKKRFQKLGQGVIAKNRLKRMIKPPDDLMDEVCTAEGEEAGGSSDSPPRKQAW